MYKQKVSPVSNSSGKIQSNILVIYWSHDFAPFKWYFQGFPIIHQFEEFSTFDRGELLNIHITPCH
ncbi:hypothetical protein ATCVBr0604L_104L [Acanthocystis turfacea Chlorella virus Br0604L]|nr:hypothetical protein ATCVBr0604L_104L [Acanthocystis turfacea Chlorella virus Br0604L]